MRLAVDRLAAAFDRGAGIATAGTGPHLTPLDLLCKLDRRTVRTPALELVSQRVQRAIDTPGSRQIVVMAPQEGKSSCVTRAGTLYALRQNPRRRVVVTSYADRIAHRFGRMIRNDIAAHQGLHGGWDCGLRMAGDQRAKIEWELTTGGGVYSVGIGGALTSRSSELMIIDDPLKGRKDADSEIVREDAWDWWEGTVTSRLSPGASVLVPLTRWHHDDLVGRLLARFPDEWDVLLIPAQADPEIVDPDPLGRAPGEFMVSARGRTREQWEQRKRDAGYEWQALYQGAPASPGGDTFDVSRLRWWTWADAYRTELQLPGNMTWLLRDCFRFITIDLAFSTKRTADWTVASCWAIPPDGSIVLLDVRRARVPEHEQIDVARPLVDRWSPEAVYVEASSRSTQLVREAVAEHWQIRDLIADRDKVTRAAGFARRLHHRLVWFPADTRGLVADQELLDYAVEELRQFPAGRHDDFVDTAAYADRVRFMDHVPPPDAPSPAPAPGLDDAVRATDVPPGWNPATADW